MFLGQYGGIFDLLSHPSVSHRHFLPFPSLVPPSLCSQLLFTDSSTPTEVLHSLEACRPPHQMDHCSTYHRYLERHTRLRPDLVLREREDGRDIMRNPEFGFSPSAPQSQTVHLRPLNWHPPVVESSSLLHGNGSEQRRRLLHQMTSRVRLDKRIFGCRRCSYVTDRKNNLKRHVMAMHRKCERLLECCHLAFDSKAALRDHVVAYHDAGYACVHCRRNFRRKALLRRHLAVHDGRKDYACAECGYATSHKSNLERHKKVHQAVEMQNWTTAEGSGVFLRAPEGKHQRGNDRNCKSLNKAITNDIDKDLEDNEYIDVLF